jgi:hypothetical protein
MSGRNFFFAIALVYGIGSIVSCSRESPVVEKKFTNIELSAFTVHPYRFRVSLYNEVVTDSLMTPEGRLTKGIFFTDYSQRIKVYNTSDETLLIDTPYTLNVGKLNVFTIYQTQADSPPFYLKPSPSEPLPAPGKTKLSLICSGDERLTDSIRVIVEIQTASLPKPKDTVVLKKDNFSKYFEVSNSLDTRVYINKYPGNQALGNKLFRVNELNADFTICRLLYQGSSTLISNKLY